MRAEWADTCAAESTAPANGRCSLPSQTAPFCCPETPSLTLPGSAVGAAATLLPWAAGQWQRTVVPLTVGHPCLGQDKADPEGPQEHWGSAAFSFSGEACSQKRALPGKVSPQQAVPQHPPHTGPHSPLTPHLQVMQLISPKGGTEGCQLWLSGNHCPAKRQPLGPSACMGSPSWGWAPDPTVGRERRKEGETTGQQI